MASLRRLPWAGDPGHRSFPAMDSHPWRDRSLFDGYSELLFLHARDIPYGDPVDIFAIGNARQGRSGLLAEPARLCRDCSGYILCGPVDTAYLSPDWQGRPEDPRLLSGLGRAHG